VLIIQNSTNGIPKSNFQSSGSNCKSQKELEITNTVQKITDVSGFGIFTITNDDNLEVFLEQVLIA